MLFPPKNACCRLTTLFCFETNIYLRVCLTFVTFFILMIEVSNSLNCWPNAIHLRSPRRGQLGRNKRRRKFLRTGKRALGMLLLTNQFHDSCGYLSSIYSKNPAKTTYKNLVSWIWHLNAQKYTNLFSLAKKNRSLYKTITPVLMVKILDFNCVRNFWQKIIVYMFPLIYICLEFH